MDVAQQMYGAALDPKAVVGEHAEGAKQPIPPAFVPLYEYLIANLMAPPPLQ